MALRVRKAVKLLLFGVAGLFLTVLGFVAALRWPRDEGYPFLAGLRPVSVGISSASSGPRYTIAHYEPDREIEDVLREANRYFGGTTGWTGEEDWKPYLCRETGWTRTYPGHIRGYDYQKGSEEVTVMFWYKQQHDERKAVEPATIVISRPATWVDEWRERLGWL